MNCRKIKLKHILLLVIIIFTIATTAAFLKSFQISWHEIPEQPVIGNSEKTILLWDNFGDLNLKPGSAIFQQFKCPQPNCSLTYDRQLLKTADAIMFHMRETIHPDQLPRLVFEERKNQRWIFVIKEPPIYSYFRPEAFHNVFNWTMTYQNNSDIPWPYGVINSRPNSLKSIADYYELKKGSRNIAWVVSRCDSDSKREDFVRKLSAHIPLDIYGKCGTLSCSRSGNDSCDEIVKKYHFYLAFENSFCPDYATEKLFKILSRKDLPAIPVVLGGSDYAKVAPPGSVIDATKYLGRIHDLAAYLNQIVNSREKYNSFHEWRKKYLVSPWGTPAALCRLCAKLHDPKESQKSYSGSELGQFWSKSSCQNNHFKTT